MNRFCLKQGQGLKARRHTSTQTSLECPPPGENSFADRVKGYLKAVTAVILLFTFILLSFSFYFMTVASDKFAIKTMFKL